MDQQFLALDLTSTQSFLLHHLSLHEHEAVYPKDLEKRFHLTHPTDVYKRQTTSPGRGGFGLPHLMASPMRGRL